MLHARARILYVPAAFVAVRLMEGGEAADRLLRNQPSLQPILQSAEAKRGFVGQIMAHKSACLREQSIIGEGTYENYDYL